jgi:hypothetical protein
VTSQSSWQVEGIAERIISFAPGPDVTIRAIRIKNERGATLMRLGASREFMEKFLYIYGDVSFEFFAGRFSGPDKRLVMTDTYTVLLGPLYQELGADVSPILVEGIRRDIESALRCYPHLDSWSGSDYQKRPLPSVSRFVFR